MTPPEQGGVIVEMFGGIRGWGEGLRTLGLTSVGVELDRDACATSVAAGHPTIRADLTEYPATAFAGAVGIIASPPCQDFSVAGKRAGRTGDRGQLIDIVPEWVDVIRPEWVVCEQVPPCLDIWREHAHRYRELGYSTWAGILNAANFGVPQTRQRAILIASRVQSVTAPEPTHAKHSTPGLFGTLEPWVTMADALGWGLTERPALTYCGGNEGGPDLAGGSGARATLRAEREAGRWELDRRQNGAPVVFPDDVPAPTLTGAAIGKGVWKVSWVQRERSGDRSEEGFDASVMPSQALTSKARLWTAWPYNSPATTVAGDPRITARCHHDEGSQGMNATSTEQVRVGDYDGITPIRLTITDALTLQGFHPNYPVQGSRTSQFLQIGNAIPPPLAAHVLAAAIGHTMEAAA